VAFDVGPAHDCPDCPRLLAFRTANRAAYPDWWNAPVPTFGQADARVLIIGLAPGLRGANRTGRPFTGDYAGELLYATLLDFGFASGAYDRRSDDGLALIDCAIANAVRCVPPQNKPSPQEISTCRRYLTPAIAALPRLKVMLALGRIAHESAVRALNLRPAKFPFAHGARHPIAPAISLFDSYHCSRYNTNTGVLTDAMFRQVFASIRAELDRSDQPAPVVG
jgi:uracil-DNA glycosylase family 4